MDGLLRKVAPGLGNHESRFANVVRRHLVRDINDARSGRDSEDHTFHGPDEMVGDAEIRRQGDETACHVLIKLN